MLDQYDADKSGTIDQQELLALLQALIPEANADERDVEFMIEHCDQVRPARPTARERPSSPCRRRRHPCAPRRRAIRTGMASSVETSWCR